MLTIEQALAFIHANSSFVGPLIFVIAFFGSLLGTNLVMPAGAALTATGVQVGAGVIAWTIVFWAACGAIMGMSVSYALGLRLGSRVRQLPLLRRRPEFMELAHGLFERYGSAQYLLAIFLGR